MAFHQPTRQAAQRITRVDPISTISEAHAPALPLTQSRDDESQTWVLFSPATDAGTTTSYLSSVEDDRPTPGRSRTSDLGSLDTIAHSDHLDSELGDSELLDEDESIEDDAELDSLDSHLPEFLNRGQQGGSQSMTILPNHDGLGSFRLDTQGLATDMQETMYQFERYNPRRIKRRRESLELGQLALESDEAQETVRRRRIEEWRLEQSRVLLQEIHKETRRRRESTLSALANQLRRASQVSTEAEAEEATMSTVDDPTPDASMAGTEWHDQDASELDLGAGEGHGEGAGYWTRATHKVIRDLLGIDDRLLCVLFGEALPDDLDLETDDLSTTPKANAHVPNTTEGDSSWQLRVLDGIACELGNLVSQLSAHPHPGAFSTYTRMQQMPIPYAGLPVIPEGADVLPTRPPVQATPETIETEDVKKTVASRRSSDVEESTMPAMPQFQPTLPTIPHTRPMSIPRTRSSDRPVEATSAPDNKQPGTFTQQEWEQDLDIKLVFRYLRNRFTSSRAAASNPPSHAQSQQPHHHSTTASQDAAAASRAAARVRQHHPLVRGVVHPQHPRRASFKVGVPAAGTMSQLQQRHPSSCASQSTKRSGRRGSMSLSSRHSSRHYWDLGAAGSVGTGSLIASTGPMGSWGEV